MAAAASSSSEKLGTNHDSSFLFDTHQYLFDSVLYIDEAHHASSMIFAIIGTVFNLLLIAVIVFAKELHHRRILMWLGMGISNILVLSSHVLIAQSVVRGSSSSERSLCYWFAVLSIIVQMFNVFYAALERHICINYPELHKTAVFGTIAITLVPLTSYISIFIVLGILNLNNFKELSQPLAFGSWHFQLIGSFFFGLLPFCLCGQMRLTKTRTNRDEPLSENITNHLNNEQPMEDQNMNKSSIVHIGDSKINQLDFKAAQNFYFLVKLHLFFTALKLIPFICISICLEINKQVLSSENQGHGSEAECSSVIKAFYFFCLLSNCFYSSFVNPAAFLLFTLIKEGGPINEHERQPTTESS